MYSSDMINPEWPKYKTCKVLVYLKIILTFPVCLNWERGKGESAFKPDFTLVFVMTGVTGHGIGMDADSGDRR